jgi:hypothetical protein
MRNDLATDHSNERYVVEVDGIAKAEYPIFMKALKASLQLKQELPKCRGSRGSCYYRFDRSGSW